MKRPALRWHGGKYRLREWVISHFPPHVVYVEPFGGAASVLMSKKPARLEIYNDTNSDVVNFFRVLRDPDMAARLKHLLELTPFSREEFKRSFEPADDLVESARRFVVRSFQSIGAKEPGQANGWRTRTLNGHNGSPPKVWSNYAAVIPEFTNRLKGAIIECGDWRRIFETYDGRETLFYVDPPYPHCTRASRYRATYGHGNELTDADHRELCQRARSLEAHVIISSYRNPIYDEVLEGWQVSTTTTRAQSNGTRVEALYLSPSVTAVSQGKLELEVA